MKNSIGILGGMGPFATHYFTEELLRAVNHSRKPLCDQDYPDMIIRYACSMPDRTTALSSQKKLFLQALLMKEIDMLQECGCSQIVIPCITAYCVLEDLIDTRPVLDMRKVVSEYIDENYGDVNVGILATTGSRASGQLHSFTNRSLQYLSSRDETRLMDLVYKRGKTHSGYNKADIGVFQELIYSLKKDGAELIITGCTEIEMGLASQEISDSAVLYPLRLTSQFLADGLRI